MASPMPGTAVTTHPKRDATARSGTTLVEQHSPGLLADKKMTLPIGHGPISAGSAETGLLLSPRPALAAATERARLL